MEKSKKEQRQRDDLSSRDYGPGNRPRFFGSDGSPLASRKQIDLLGRLCGQLGCGLEEFLQANEEHLHLGADNPIPRLSMTEATDLITIIKDMKNPKLIRSLPAEPDEDDLTRQEIEDHLHKLGEWKKLQRQFDLPSNYRNACNPFWHGEFVIIHENLA